MTQEVFTDKRLLGALDYIDERFIAEVTEDYEFEAPGVYRPNKKAHRRAYRQFAAMAACLILLTTAFPVVGKFLAGKGVNLGGWGGNAGAGTSELEMPTPTETQALNTEPEMTQVLETEPAETQAEVIDSGFDKALERYANMSAEEIYADVLKGGWIVQDSDFSSPFDAGEDIWQDFLDSVDNKTPTSVLFADFTISNSCVRLSKICCDGETFTITQQRRDDTSVIETETKEFKYFLRSRWPCYFFTNNLDSDPANCISSDSKDVANLESYFVVIWSNINSQTEE